MAKNKSQLRTENSNNFPNNNSQFITPEKLRDFNNDMIDSLVVSSDSGSFITTSSFDTGSRNLTFTKADGTTYTNNIPGGGGGGSTDTGSLLTTASVSDATITFTKGDSSTFDITVNNVVNSTSSSHSEFAEDANDLIVRVKNTSGSPIVKGNVLHATGVTGENINVELADNTNSANMPGFAIANESIGTNATGQAIVSGKITGIDTSGLTAGANVYVNQSGGFTGTKPTGSALIQNIGVVGKVNASEGELVVLGSGRSNDLPNITEGYIWVGDSNDVPEEFSTGSIAFINKDNTFTGTQSFDNISVSGTGSFGYLESVTGSAKIIGDAFLILNNDTPSQRYAGIKVIDSGSTGATASLQFDGQTNDWFYEYTASGDPTNHGVVMFGPEYGTIGSPTYLTDGIIPIGNGGHHLNDSNLLQTGGGSIEFFTNSSPGQYEQIIINGDSTQGGGAFMGYVIKDAGVAGNEAYLALTTFDTEDSGNGVYQLGMGPNNSTQGRVLFSVYQSGEARCFRDLFMHSGTGFTTEGDLIASGGVSFAGGNDFNCNMGAFFTSVVNLDGTTTISGEVSSSNYISASAFIGDGSQLTGIEGGIFVETGSYYSTTNDLQVTGSFGVNGAIGGKNSDLTISSNTASIDLTTSNTFTVTLVSSADTHLDVSTFGEDAQSVNILVKQPTSGNTGSISFSDDFKFGQGYTYTPTPQTSSEDILSFTRFGNSLYGTYINNFN